MSGDVVVPPQLLLAVAPTAASSPSGMPTVTIGRRFVFGSSGFTTTTSVILPHASPYAKRTAAADWRRRSKRPSATTASIRDRGIAWTMDPLEARNAAFNFAKLGAFTREYHRDFLRPMPDKLNSGLPSDRIYVEWPIGHTATYKRSRRRSDAVARGAEGEGIAYTLPPKASVPVKSHPQARRPICGWRYGQLPGPKARDPKPRSRGDLRCVKRSNPFRARLRGGRFCAPPTVAALLLFRAAPGGAGRGH